MNTGSPDSSVNIITTALPSQITQKTKLHLNLDQAAILTTEDKVRLVLFTHLQGLEKRKAWIAPAGVFITILTSFVTTNFKDFWLKAATWEAVFIIAGIMSFAWLVYAIIQALKAPGIDDVVSELKKSGHQDGEPIISKETETQEAEDRNSFLKVRAFSFDEDAKKVLKFLDNRTYSWRTSAGIAQDTRMPEEKVLNLLDWLTSSGLAFKDIKKGRWQLTSEGRDILHEMSAGEKSKQEEKE